MAVDELVIPVSAPRDTFSSGFDPLSNYDFGSYASDASLGQQSELPANWVNDSTSESFVSPGVPVQLLPTVEVAASRTIATTIAEPLLPLIALAWPQDAGPKYEDVSGPKYDFTPNELPVIEMTIEGQRGINKPPPITPAQMDTGFPSMPPDWNALATENTGNVFTRTPERAKDFLDYLIEKLPGASRLADLVDLTLRVTDTGRSDVPSGKPAGDRTGISVGPDYLPTRTSRVDPAGTVVYGYTAPLGDSLDAGTDLSPFNVDSLAQPAGRTVPGGSAAPEPSPVPVPTRRPSPDPFVTPTGAPNASPFDPIGSPIGDPIVTKFSEPVPTATPLDPILNPFNPGDPRLSPEPQPEPQADHCNCNAVKTKTKPDKKKKKKRKDKDKCFEYTNRQYKDGTVRLETKEIPCETKKGRPRKTRSDKGKKRAGPKYGKPGQFPTTLGVF